MKDNKRIEQTIDRATNKELEKPNGNDEPMSGAQRSFLKALSDELKASFNENLTKAQASKRIEELQRWSTRSLC